MTDIDAIRRKHEKCKNFVRDSGHDENYYHAHLTVAEVDALFAALDLLQKEYDQYKEMVGESLIKEVKRLDTALDAERGKAKTVVAYVEDVLIGSDHDYAGKRIIEILTGEG